MNTRDDRSAMVRTQLEQRGIRDSQVLDAMAYVPRHLFVPEAARRGGRCANARPPS